MAQCEEVTGRGLQCDKQAMPGARFCEHHAGNSTVEAQARQETRNYRLHLYQQRLDDKHDSPRLKSLKEEIALLRVMIETKINACQDDTDLMMQSSSLATLIGQVEKLVTSCHRMDTLTKNVLDRSELMSFAISVINIIQKYVSDPDTLEAISEELVAAVSLAGLVSEE